MKKLILIIILFTLVISGLFAEKLKLATLNFDAKDDGSKYMIGKTGIYRDLKMIFKKSDDFELLKTDDTRKVYKNSGYSNLNAIEPKEVLDFSQSIGADIIIWGDILSESNRFKLLVSLLNTKNVEKMTITIDIPKASKKRQPIIKEALLKAIEELTSDKNEEILNIAKQYFANKQYNLAKIEYKKLYDADPENIEVILALGYINFKQSNYSKAENYYRIGLKSDNENEKIRDFLITLLIQQERFQEAAEELEIVAENDGENVELALRIGMTYAMSDDLVDEAIEAFEKVLEIDENNLKAKRELGLLLFIDESYQSSIEYLSEANKEWPEDEDVAKKLSIAYLKAGKLEEAIHNYQELIKIVPNETKNYLNLANAYRILATERADQGNVAEAKKMNQNAINTLNDILKIEANNITAVLRISDAYIALGNMSKAEEFANKAKAIDENNITAYKLLIKVYHTKAYKRFNEYVDFQKQASKALGDDVNILNEKRNKAMDESNRLFGKAKANIQKALKLSQNASEQKSLQRQLKDINKQLQDSKKDDFFD